MSTLDRLRNYGKPRMVGKYRDDQIAQQSTWAGVPDDQTTLASLTTIHIVPAHASTETFVNPLDAGLGNEAWLLSPSSDAPVIPVGR